MADRHRDLPIEDYSSYPSASGLKLDLYNFESVYAEDSPYVLTSPRSLEACAQLDIKPVELLVKPVSDFEEECLLSGQPISYARHMYEAFETNRLEKLKFCRQIRERIILDEDDQTDSDQNEMENENIRKSVCSKSELSLSSSLKHSPRQAKALPVVEIGQGDHQEDNSHQTIQVRTSPSENKMLSKKPERKERPTSTIARKKKQQSQSSASGSIQQDSSMLSLSSTRSHGTSGRSSRLTSLDMLSDRDKKILDLLETKHLVKQAEERVKHLTKLAWEDERMTDEAAKMEAERKRRENLLETNSRRQRKQEWRHRQRLNEELTKLEMAHQQLFYNEEKHKRLVETQNKLKALDIHHKKIQKMEKKKRQEKRLHEQEKDEENFRRMVNENLATSLDRAADIKQRKEQMEVLERQRRNIVERARHEALRESYNKQSEEDIECMHYSIRLKHDRAERSLQSQTQHRNQQLQYQREKELIKQIKNQQTKQEIQKELEEWKHHVIVHGRRSQQRAVEQASQTSLQKASKASHIRRSRERIHRELMDKVKEGEDAEKDYIRQKIAYKDYKTRTHSAERDKAIQRSREIARVSAELRDNIRKQYSGTFDKMVQQAELESKVGTGPQSAIKNFSSVGLF